MEKGKENGIVMKASKAGIFLFLMRKGRVVKTRVHEPSQGRHYEEDGYEGVRANVPSRTQDGYQEYEGIKNKGNAQGARHGLRPFVVPFSSAFSFFCFSSHG